MSTTKRLPRFPHQFFYFIALGIRKMLKSGSDRLVTPQMAVYEKAQGFWVARAVYSACELNLADHLLTGPKDISELSRLTGTNKDFLYRLLRALAGEGVFRELPGQVFENNKLSQWLSDQQGSVKYLILHQFNPVSSELLVRLSESVRKGEDIAMKVLGTSGYKHQAANPEKNEIYQRSMEESSTMISLAFLSAYDFSGIRTLVDAGGGKGILLADILEAYPGLKGILFDQPHVVALATEAIGRFSEEGRLKIIGGDLFEVVPEGADAYLMKNILHTFDDEKCMQVLKNIRKSITADGKLLILEAVVRSDNAPALGKLLDLLMMTGTEGGKERTKEEFADLLDCAGFKINRIIRTVAPFSVIEAVRKQAPLSEHS